MNYTCNYTFWLINCPKVSKNILMPLWGSSLLKLFPPIRYSIEQDPAGWFRVDKTTGEVFVKEPLDRESSHVTNGTYTVTVLVTEKGNSIWMFCIWQKLHPSIFQNASYPSVSGRMQRQHLHSSLKLLSALYKYYCISCFTLKWLILHTRWPSSNDKHCYNSDPHRRQER